MPDSARLFTACREGNLAEIQSLLAEDPRLGAALDDKGMSAALTALYHGHRDAARLLAQAVPDQDLFTASALDLQDRVVHLLADDRSQISQYSQDGWTPLHVAAFFGAQHTAETLLANGADVNARSRNRMANTPLHAAAAGRQEAVATTLLAHGADVRATQHGGYTPLHSAAANHDVEFVKLLTAHGALLSARTDDGQTPADMAQAKGYTDLAELLKAR